MRSKRKNLLKISKQLFFCLKAKTVYRRSNFSSILRHQGTLSPDATPFSKGELTAFYILGSPASLLL
jgi:hypothetical protein